MSEEAEKEGFLSRWSRRKRAAAEAPPPAEQAEGEVAEPRAEPASEPAEPAAAPGKPQRAACPIPNLPEIDLASLPRIEELTAESDFSLFLRPGVPSALRSAALRRMWSLDPAIRDYIGPVEYQWDFNTPGGLPLGFASELGGEVKKLLAQAIGQLDPEEEQAKPGAGEGVPATPDSAGPPPAEAPSEAPAAPEEAPPAPLVAEAPAEPMLGATAAPPRRRHGGALPG